MNIVIDVIGAPLLVGLTGLAAWIVRSLARISEDLAVLKDQITPAGGRRLVDTVNDHTRDIALLKNNLAQLQENRP